jgi:glucose-1-phosphate cytidylyltransferase
MKYYAHFGHKEFILCLGYKGEMIKEFFLNYDSYRHRNFVLRNGGRKLDPESSDIDDWTIHFVDTGLHSNIGQRLLRVRDYLEGEKRFLANYSDQLTDFPLDKIIDFHDRKEMVASILSAKPPYSFHAVSTNVEGIVTRLAPLAGDELWLNGGYMVLSSTIFDYLNEGEELVEEPFHRLIGLGKLGTVRWNGFYAPMDTFKDKITYDRMHGRGERPWEVWKNGA